ncbi:MAG: signal peptidase II [Deltaproteobacteria bacterium]|nr:MAG: signal peptidase II [Deltaproteobacteria bacterium]
MDLGFVSRLWITVAVSIVLIFIDQYFKGLIIFLEKGEFCIISGFFSIIYRKNFAAAFSFFSCIPIEKRLIFLLISGFLSILFFIFYLFKCQNLSLKQILCFNFIIGGAISNLYDRWSLGYVVDFLDVYYKDWHWPTFNTADTFIVVGIFGMLHESVILHGLVKKKACYWG